MGDPANDATTIGPVSRLGRLKNDWAILNRRPRADLGRGGSRRDAGSYFEPEPGQRSDSAFPSSDRKCVHRSPNLGSSGPNPRRPWVMLPYIRG
jgi:hypothetical protein